MRSLRQIISFILLLVFGMSAVFNILFLLGISDVRLSQTGIVILIAVVFLVSLLGFILKKATQSEVYPVNIISPAKELGILYIGTLIIWVTTYFLAIINR